MESTVMISSLLCNIPVSYTHLYAWEHTIKT